MFADKVSGFVPVKVSGDRNHRAVGAVVLLIKINDVALRDRLYRFHSAMTVTPVGVAVVTLSLIHI